MKNLMRISVVLLMIGFNCFSIIAQKNVSDKMFNNLKNLDEVTYFSFSKNLIDFIDFDIDDDDRDDDHKVTGDLNEVKLIIFNPDEKPDVSFHDQVLKYLKKGNYKLIEDEDEPDDTEIWVNRKGRKVYECHIIFQGEQNGVLLSFFGDFKIEDVDKFKGKIEDYK